MNIVVEVNVAKNRDFTTLVAEFDGMHEQLAGDAVADRLQLLVRIQRTCLLESEHLRDIPLLVCLALGLHLEEVVVDNTRYGSAHDKIVVIVAVDPVDLFAAQDL
ncbi:hypothetical protein SB783_27950 [Paraburkholderia sp. SIMBA_009]|nr:hypothetical protein [Paraburkholderia tropica]